MRRTFVPLGIACVLTVGVIGPAGAATGSTISANDGSHSITYTAGSGQANNPTVSVAHTEGEIDWVYTIHDVAPITPGVGCSVLDPSDPTTATCVLREGGDFYVGMQFYLGDGVDRIDFTAADSSPSGLGGYAVIWGGPGNDVLVSSGAEYLYGEDGNDTLVGGLIRGGNGNDTIINADDGLGEAGNDTITGTDDVERGDRLLGGPGNDMISAGAGPDTVYGNSGLDRIIGGTGNDELSGGPGDDTVYGNSGDDHVVGGPGKDYLSGGPGIDVVKQ